MAKTSKKTAKTPKNGKRTLGRVGPLKDLFDNGPLGQSRPTGIIARGAKCKSNSVHLTSMECIRDFSLIVHWPNGDWSGYCLPTIEMMTEMLDDMKHGMFNDVHGSGLYEVTVNAFTIGLLQGLRGPLAPEEV